MTIDPKKICEVARVCEAFSKSASTAEEHDTFAELARSWLGIALEKETQHKETQLAIDLDRFDDDGGAPGVGAASWSSDINKTRGPTRVPLSAQSRPVLELGAQQRRVSSFVF